MTYDPTTWVDFGVPCVSAANLNKMEHGIDIAQGDIMVLHGTTAAIPASDAELVGRLYFETDGARRVLRDNGAGWDVVMTRHLLQTGQTTQYGGYDDDGFYEEGIAKDYTVLTAGQYAGTTNIVLNAKTDVHSNNCVQDNITGLMWSRYVSASVGPANNGLLPWTTAGGEGIFPYIAAANTASLAGYADWRVPNIFELYSLPNMEAPTGQPDAVAFPVWPDIATTWSSTSRPNTTTWAVGVYWRQGDITSQVKTAATWSCALVRG